MSLSIDNMTNGSIVEPIESPAQSNGVPSEVEPVEDSPAESSEHAEPGSPDKTQGSTCATTDSDASKKWADSTPEGAPKRKRIPFKFTKKTATAKPKYSSVARTAIKKDAPVNEVAVPQQDKPNARDAIVFVVDSFDSCPEILEKISTVCGEFAFSGLCTVIRSEYKNTSYTIMMGQYGAYEAIVSNLKPLHLKGCKPYDTSKAMPSRKCKS